ncbi:unnamed protein product [Linum tenue]|uniref:F-box domain-containing protein n=1 Tax=Linum tenue TaxID=586396 RepID=A0AAV0K2Q0_9ROSI|nr:unnamed protein product [Linum tenue]
MSSDCKSRRRENKGSEEVDRISNLPDEVIHEILALLNSPQEAAKSSILSSTWFRLWRSYPILEFHDTHFKSTQSVKGFVSTAREKFSRRSDGTLIPMKAVRIKFNVQKKWPLEICSAFLDDMLELVANRSHPPQEIDIAAEFHKNIGRTLNFNV